MASLISVATGDFTSAATWAVADATSILDSEATSTNSTTSYVYSSTFVPGAITVDGVAVKVANMVAAPTGTVTIELNNHTDTVSVDSQTIDVSDIGNTLVGSAYNRGWYFFKFAAPQLLVAGKAYKIGFKSSVNAEVAIYRNSTVGNWSRMLRTTTTAAPAVDDQLHVIGEHTGAGARTDFVVTMENTATTSFGPVVSATWPQGATVGKGGTLNFAFAAATNYYLKLKGVLTVNDGGVFTIGTAADPIPAASTATYDSANAANVNGGIQVLEGGTFTTYGATQNNVQTLMTASRGGWCSTAGTAITRLYDSQGFTGLTGTININGINRTISSVSDNDNLIITASAGTNSAVAWFHVATADVITVADTTGWAVGDALAFATGRNTSVESEKGIILTVDSPTQVTLTTGLLFMHYGVAPMQCEVVNLTRNVKMLGASATLGGYLECSGTATVNLYYTEFSWMGGAGRVGIQAATTTGLFNMEYCSRYDSTVASSKGLAITSTSGSNISVLNNVFYNIKADWISTSGTTGTNTISGNTFMLGGAIGMTFADHGHTFANNRVCGSSGELIFISDTLALGAWSGIVFHGFAGSVSAIRWTAAFAAANTTLSNTTVWGASGNANGQLRFDGFLSDFTIDGLTVFFAATVHVGIRAGCVGVVINNFTSNEGPVSSNSSTGVLLGVTVGTVNILKLTNSTLSAVSGFYTQNLKDIDFITNGCWGQVVANNCTLNGVTAANNISNAATGSFVGSSRLGGVAGVHKIYRPFGTSEYDGVIYSDAPSSSRLTPNNAANRLESVLFDAPVKNGADCTIKVYVRESVIGDGTDYDGQRARLWVRRNDAAGITADTLLATATVASEGAFELITGTTPVVTDDCVLSFFVDCGGSGYSTGWVNIDTASATPSNSAGGFQFWQNGAPVIELAGGSSGSAVTYA